MDSVFREQSGRIIGASIQAVMPEEAVSRALEQFLPGQGRVLLLAIGKAAYSMARAALEQVSVDEGYLITKYGHVKEPLPGIRCFEAGHPVPDQNGFAATRIVLEAFSDLRPEDVVLFLVSGGGSALFEDPLVSPEVLQSVTSQLLNCGADIRQINTIRKRLSGVKGGKFAAHCAPAKIYSIILSDVVGDPLDMIASGPAVADTSTCEEALAIVEQYKLPFPNTVMELLHRETPKECPNVTNKITGSLHLLCDAAQKEAEALGYHVVRLGEELTGIARETGVFLADEVRRSIASFRGPVAIIGGGETVVKVTGNGKGGRNQEIALAACKGLDGLPACVFSVGTDGTDGPTDAAGGFVDGSTYQKLRGMGIDPEEVLDRNDSYNALSQVGGLIFTGPTGTNVNDLTVALIQP